MKAFSTFALAIALFLTNLHQLFAAEMTRSEGRTEIAYSGIDDEFATAIVKVVETARTIASDEYGYFMPDKIRVSVKMDPKGETRLFNDGTNFISLTVRTERDLRKPSATGIFHIYGFCHEVAHLTMYGPVKDRGWLTTAAAEGWAHYLGSRLVDDVFKRLGAELWPDRYDYLEDGTKRLNRQLARQDQSDVTVRGAELWQNLRAILNDREIAALFDNWGNATIDPKSPDASLEQAFSSTANKDDCMQWWKSASPVFVSRRSASGFTTRTAKTEELAGNGQTLTIDDGKPAGKQSTAGGAHGVRFQASAEEFYLTGVRIHGGRYGSKEAPKEDFVVTICDEEGEVISTAKLPYNRFGFGKLGWTQLELKPALVPRTFIVFAEFNPTQRKGVFVSHDAELDGNSYSNLPGKKLRASIKGDWLIRAEVDQLKLTDALREQTTKDQGNR